MYSRIPIHLQSPEIAKALSNTIDNSTDLKKLEKIPTERMLSPQYRTPTDRVNGNELFRRYPDGALDYEAAKHIVIDSLNKLKQLGPDGLTRLEQSVLCCLFPDTFDFVDQAMVESIRKVMCKISREECKKISVLVALHLNEVMNHNAGYGGGSVMPRSETQT